jgi:hypothetical protein
VASLPRDQDARRRRVGAVGAEPHRLERHQVELAHPGQHRELDVERLVLGQGQRRARRRDLLGGACGHGPAAAVGRQRERGRHRRIQRQLLGGGDRGRHLGQGGAVVDQQRDRGGLAWLQRRIGEPDRQDARAVELPALAEVGAAAEREREHGRGQHDAGGQRAGARLGDHSSPRRPIVGMMGRLFTSARSV